MTHSGFAAASIPAPIADEVVGLKRVECIKLRIAPPRPAVAELFDRCVQVQRAVWNWLVAMDRPAFDARRKNYAQAMAQAKAEMPEGSQSAIKKRASELCRSLDASAPPFSSKAVLGKGGKPAETFVASINPEHTGLLAALEAVEQAKCKSLIYEVLRRYKTARDGAMGFASGKQRKKRLKPPRFLSRRDTDLHASVAWQVQEDGQKRPTIKLGQWRFVRKGRSGSLCQSGVLKLKGALGWVRFRDAGKRLTEALRADALTDMVRLVRERNKWYVVFDVTYHVAVPPPKAAAIGLDRGVTVPVATSEGGLEGREVLRVLRRLEKRKVRLQRVAARRLRAAAKAAGALDEHGGFRRGIRIPRSKRWIRVNALIAAQSAKIARHREAWQAEMANRLASRYGLVAIEDLATQRMTRSAKGTADAPGRNVAAKAALNKAILDVGWASFAARLEHALARRGGLLVRVDPAYTSQTCNRCGAVDADSRKGEIFRCVHCGHEDHADINAAKNILARALESEVGGRNPEPADANRPMRVEGPTTADSSAEGFDEARRPWDSSAPVVAERPGSARKA